MIVDISSFISIRAFKFSFSFLVSADKTLLTFVVDSWFKFFEAFENGAFCLRDKGCHVCRLHMGHLDLRHGGQRVNLHRRVQVLGVAGETSESKP